MPNRKFIIASHAYFADGIRSALEMILGEMPNVFSVCAYTDESKPFLAEMEKLIHDAENENAEVVILSDLFAGSVNNEIMQKFLRKGIHIIAGINLILAVQLIMAEPDSPLEELIPEAIDQARNGMIYCNILRFDEGEEK